MPAASRRSPSPQLNLGRLKQGEQGLSKATDASGEASPPFTVALQTPLSTRSNSLRLGALSRRLSRVTRACSIRTDRRESLRFESHKRKLVPVPEDLTREEAHQVEDDFARFGPIGTQLELTEFLASIGENINEEELLVLLRRIVVERSAEEAATRREMIARNNPASGESARGRTASIMWPSMANTTPTGSGVLTDTTPSSFQLSDDDDSDQEVAEHHHHHHHGKPATNSKASTTTTSTNRDLRNILRKRFLRPFFSLDDTLVLLRHIKAGVLLNRSSLDEAKEVFDALCADGRGMIDAAEFLRITKTFSLKLDVEQFVKEVDEDNSGQIELAEFRHLLGKVSGGRGGSLVAHRSASRGAYQSKARGMDDDTADLLEDYDGEAQGDPCSAGVMGSTSVAYDASLVGTPSVVEFGGVPPVGQDGGGSGPPAQLPDGPTVELQGSLIGVAPSSQQGFHRMSKSPPSSSLLTAQHTAAPGVQPADPGAVLDAQIRQIRREMMSDGADPLAGIEAARPLASYIALQKRTLVPIKVRPARPQRKMVPLSNRQPANGGPPAPVVGRDGRKQPSPTRVGGAQPPRRLPPVDSTTSHAQGHTSDTLTPKHRSPAAPAAGGGGETILPPMLRPNRQPFHVVEGVFPAWRESYLQYMRPM